MVSNLGVFDFETDDHTMRLRSRHPGVTVNEIVEATGFDLVIPDDVAESRLPTAEELELIREVIDPDGAREPRGAGPGVSQVSRMAATAASMTSAGCSPLTRCTTSPWASMNTRNG